MKYLVSAALLALASIGCDNRENGMDPIPPDNTGVNTRDRNDDAVKTPVDQNENEDDVDITARIRKRIMDADLSLNAQNVKVITQDGKVTLRGPVKSDDEKKRIDEIATNVAGAGKVDNQIEIE